MKKEASKIKNRVLSVVNHATMLLQKKKPHKDNQKNIYWVFFDKQLRPYWMVDENDFMENHFNIDIYTINPKSNVLLRRDVVANQDFQIIDNEAELDFIEINHMRNLNRKIGSTLIDLFEYITFVSGAKKAKGAAVPFRKDKIQINELKKFYAYKGYNIEEGLAESSAFFEKELDPQKIKKIATSILTLKKDNLAFKVLVPNNLKKEVEKLLDEEKAQQKETTKER